MTEELSREIMGNIDRISRLVFYALAALSTGSFAYGLWRRGQRWNLRELLAGVGDWKQAGRRLYAHALLQRKVRQGRSGAGLAHAALFMGFVILFIGTVLVGIEHYSAALAGREAVNPLFHKGGYFAAFELVLDLGGLALIAGCGWFIARRFRAESSMEHRVSDWAVVGSLLFLGVSGYVIEGARILIEDTAMPGFSPVGWLVSLLLPSGPEALPGLKLGHKIIWWFHAVAALGFIAALPYCRLLHIVAGTLNIGLRNYRLGAMEPVSMAQVEETGKLGLGEVSDINGARRLALDACVSCGRCEDACPAHAAGKPLSPRDLVQDIRRLTELPEGGPALHGDTITADTLWACTTCGACVEQCPVDVAPLDFISELRRHLIGEGGLAGAPAATLQKTQRAGNPWGLPAGERFDWADGLGVPTVKENPDFEILYWVGCSASYDPRVRKVARAVAQLLQKAGVNFACLGPEERCTGDFARRMGDEFLFQELAETNVATMKGYEVKRIVTHCPHCLNSLAQDYPQFAGNYEVIHHAQLLSELVNEGRLKPAAGINGRITYHDPCYLARAQGIVDEPRQVLVAAVDSTGGGEMVEMPRCGKGTACCGGGGGRMWFDDQADQRIGRDRVQEIIQTRAEIVAVSCPFCMTMTTDGLAAQDSDMQVKDIAELLHEAVTKR